MTSTLRQATTCLNASIITHKNVVTPMLKWPRFLVDRWSGHALAGKKITQVRSDLRHPLRSRMQQV